MKYAVACICVGDKYKVSDIKILERMVFQNTTYDINFRVFDEPLLPKWWTKVLYHSPIIEPFKEEVILAFDLDVVIKGNIDPLFDWVEQQDYLCAPWARWREHMDDFEYQRDNNIHCTPYNSSILGPIRIPDHFYYSAHFEQYKELDYPIVLFNKGQSIGLEKHEITSKVPWVNKYR